MMCKVNIVIFDNQISTYIKLDLFVGEQDKTAIRGKNYYDAEREA